LIESPIVHTSAPHWPIVLKCDTLVHLWSPAAY